MHAHAEKRQFQVLFPGVIPANMCARARGSVKTLERKKLWNADSSTSNKTRALAGRRDFPFQSATDMPEVMRPSVSTSTRTSRHLNSVGCSRYAMGTCRACRTVRRQYATGSSRRCSSASSLGGADGSRNSTRAVCRRRAHRVVNGNVRVS